MGASAMNSPLDSNQSNRMRRQQARTVKKLFAAKKALLALAAVPLFQATGCYPDVLGAFNFELQRLLTGLLVDALDIIVRNLLNL